MFLAEQTLDFARPLRQRRASACSAFPSALAGGSEYRRRRRGWWSPGSVLLVDGRDQLIEIRFAHAGDAQEQGADHRLAAACALEPRQALRARTSPSIRAADRAAASRRRRSPSTHWPGAVPRSLGRISAPSMTNAWRLLTSAILRLVRRSAARATREFPRAARSSLRSSRRGGRVAGDVVFGGPRAAREEHDLPRRQQLRGWHRPGGRGRRR